MAEKKKSKKTKKKKLGSMRRFSTKERRTLARQESRRNR